MTNVLVVEDHDQLAGAVGRELEVEHGYSVASVRDPLAMRTELEQNAYDLVVVDLLFAHLSRDFDNRRLSGHVGLSAPSLLITGLTAIRIVRTQAPETRIVVWTSGEANRRLHLLYSYEEFGQRIFCSKSPGTGRVDTLADALKAAAGRSNYFDPVLNPYLPASGAISISHTLLHDECRRAVWRAIAIGAHNRAQIARLTGYSERYIGHQIPKMYAELRAFDPGLPESRQPHIEVVRYAATNWEFFLDDAVRHAYP